jgi:uncharacterized SAM-binding protein YcdF (DUF218 family)
VLPEIGQTGAPERFLIALAELGHFIRSTLPAFFIPPANLPVWIVLGLGIMRFRRRVGIAIVTISIGLLYALSLPVVGGMLIGSLERGQPAAQDGPAPGAIIILGADSEFSPDLEAKAVPGQLSLQRLAGAARLTRTTRLPVLITGGKLGRTQAPVADLMADLFLNAFGLPVAWRETEAENTCENARFSARVLRKAGVSSAFVVTHAWHMRRTILAFQRAGFPISPAPLHDDAWQSFSALDLLPRTSAWSHSYWAIHEWIGILAYRADACPAVSPEARQDAALPSVNMSLPVRMKLGEALPSSFESRQLTHQ